MSESLSEPACETPLEQTAMSENSHDVEAGLMLSSAGQSFSYRDHRKLAISSIICGLSCFGIMSLIYSVKTRATNKGKLHAGDPERRSKAKEYSKKALRYGIIAILSWVGLIILTLLLIHVVSYLLTLIN